MYTKAMYRNEMLKIIQSNGYDPFVIARKTFSIFSEHIREIDSDLREKLIDIFIMEDGPEFEMKEQEFKDFLDNI